MAKSIMTGLKRVVENDVYGNMLESMPVVTVEQINKRASEFKSNWLRFENRVRLAETNSS